MEVWRYAAPSIDVISPDIYVPYFTEICDIYTKMDNPLFIPETATHSHCAPRLIYTIGHYHATCFAPFGFEDMGQPFNDISAYLFGGGRIRSALTDATECRGLSLVCINLK